MLWSFPQSRLVAPEETERRPGPPVLAAPKKGNSTMYGVRGLFVPGPTNVPDEVRKAIDLPMEDHRAPTLPELTLPLFQDLKKVFKSETGLLYD